MIAGEDTVNDCITFSLVLSTAIDSVTNGHLDNVAKTMFSGWRETHVYYPYKLYSITNKPQDIPSK